MNNQLKKGVSEILILEFLSKTENYGYKISEYLNQYIEMKQSSVYIILSRLEQTNYLDIRVQKQGNRDVKYYLITDEGRVYLKQLYDQWDEINVAIAATKEYNEQ